MEIFNYDTNSNYEDNYRVWFQMNSKERENYGQKPYDREKAEEVFYTMFGHHAPRFPFPSLKKYKPRKV